MLTLKDIWADVTCRTFYATLGGSGFSLANSHLSLKDCQLKTPNLAHSSRDSCINCTKSGISSDRKCYEITATKSKQYFQDCADFSSKHGFAGFFPYPTTRVISHLTNQKPPSNKTKIKTSMSTSLFTCKVWV